MVRADPSPTPSDEEQMTQRAVLHVWGVNTSMVPPALGLTGAWQLARLGPTAPSFGKALGTGSGRTFTMRDADPHHWGLLTVWSDAAAAAEFEKHWLVRSWRRCAYEQLRLEMRPISTRGQWSKVSPFQPGSASRHDTHRVAAITRARIRPRYWRTFARSVPQVSTDAHAMNGPMFSLGIGEAPIGLQGTFSIWQSHADIDAFAYQRTAHREVIARTQETGWYAEELFARFAVLACEGTYNGAAVELS